MRLLLAFIVICSSLTANAEEIFPAGCTPFVVNGEQINLPASTSTVVMIHNLSETDLWMTHPVTNAGASAGWSSQLQAGNWSALALNGKAFSLSCIESKPGHEQQIQCNAVVAVCQWTNAKLPANTSGTFWAGENMALSPLTAYIERRGFVLSAPTQAQ